MRSENSSSEEEQVQPRIYIDLGSHGLFGRIIGVLICLLTGMTFGALGSFVAGVFPVFAISGILGADEPSIFGLAISGYWLFALFGVLPGAIIGGYLGFSRSEKYTVLFLILALLSGCGSEWAYEYPSNILAACVYYLAPVLSLMISVPLVRAAKIRFGLYTKEESIKMQEIVDNSFGGNRD